MRLLSPGCNVWMLCIPSIPNRFFYFYFQTESLTSLFLAHTRQGISSYFKTIFKTIFSNNIKEKYTNFYDGHFTRCINSLDSISYKLPWSIRSAINSLDRFNQRSVLPFESFADVDEALRLSGDVPGPPPDLVHVDGRRAPASSDGIVHLPRLNERTDGRTNEWTNEWMNIWMNEWKIKRMDGRINLDLVKPNTATLM